MNKNDFLTVDITDLSAEGSGIGKYDGMAVFVPLTAIGDRVRVKVIKVKKNYCIARLEEILIPSSERIDTDCATFNRCGGCVFRHISYDGERAFKQNRVYQTIKRIGGIDMAPQPIISAERTERYRNKAQLPISPSGRAGFYAKHSHRIIECDDCLLQPKEFSLAIDALYRWISETGVSVYDETSHKGLVRHLYLRKAEKTGEILAVIVINGNSIPESEKLTEYMRSALPEIKSLQLNINTEDTNVVLGDKNILLFGSEYITDILSGVKIRLSPHSFYQVNHDCAELLYEKAAQYANPQGKTVLDLYCGAGTIGLSMADTAKQIIGVEIVPQAIEDAKFNAENNGIKNAEFLCADAFDAAKRLSAQGIKPDVVIVDPPRKGCDTALIDTICNGFAPERVVYVSCDVATLARDIAQFTKNGYTLIEYTPVDMFPRTAHVETVALLSRQKVDEHIYFDVNVQDLPKTARTTATYPEIKAYVKDKYGLNVTSLNIAQVKEKHGFEKRENYNKGKDGHRVPNCPPEKEKAIEDAFKHFGML